MGLYLNPNAEAFLSNTRAKIYVDKSLILEQINSIADSSDDFVCLSRPRRFGKSMIGNMISAYYSKGCDTREVFSKMKIGQTPEWDARLNKYNVIKLDLNEWYQKVKKKGEEEQLIKQIDKRVAEEFKVQFKDIVFSDEDDSIDQCILRVYDAKEEKFVIIIDEYDVLVREKVPQKLFDDYLSFLINLFKGTTIRPAIALAYITGIMPIVRDKVQSKLNEFREYTMLNPRQFAGAIGFTQDEVEMLCKQYNMNPEECARWYDGYRLGGRKIYNSHSIVSAMLDGEFSNNWTNTGSFEAISDYIKMNFDGILEDVTAMLSGRKVKVDPTSFLNTLDSFKGKDDVFTYLIHLGYLAFDKDNSSCYIPNEEVRQEWVKAVKYDDNYKKVYEMIKDSEELLNATINGDEEAVAKALENAHSIVTNPKTYNDEYCFQSAIVLAYFYANSKYTIIKEMPSGNGYADIVLIPYKPNIPAIVIELKHNHSTDSAIAQIKAKNYTQALSLYTGNILLVGINYDEKDKKHTCKIGRVVK